MSRLPTITPQKMAKVLEKMGFTAAHQTGSHSFYQHPDGRTTTVAIHSKDLPRGTMKKILRDIRLSEDEFQKLL
ncbi:MAG: type II toxin-antitoxin system HicA family toxin [Candidatus Omnitrophica bacterium]|nr:type II toxin-antitoxin system HicA family toxin [Candidatus Omnitrophota bacterium]